MCAAPTTTKGAGSAVKKALVGFFAILAIVAMVVGVASWMDQLREDQEASDYRRDEQKTSDCRHRTEGEDVSEDKYCSVAIGAAIGGAIGGAIVTLALQELYRRLRNRVNRSSASSGKPVIKRQRVLLSAATKHLVPLVSARKLQTTLLQKQHDETQRREEELFRLKKRSLELDISIKEGALKKINSQINH